MWLEKVKRARVVFPDCLGPKSAITGNYVAILCKVGCILLYICTNLENKAKIVQYFIYPL
ncbi:hypothetical protein Aasi_1455 [Candidatus Amoebophilus asiaticus 5a2]|uniref:Uncharacterized protein n=1 Tax=Amoebophilus asiaticus (strain 5a2) TaxID=452471 RepID=C3L4B8_AMOA5|nr:hypothetical protein Aasi_1455 [Candidatus Amoebophilus asiaticus 5a2]